MTSSMPWVKLYTEMLDDPKLGRLDDAARWRFIQMILLAGECDAEGYLVVGNSPMSLDDIAWRLRLDVAALERDILPLANLGLLENTEQGWRVVKFSERQGRKQSEKREIWRENKSKQRKTDKGPAWEPTEKPQSVLEDTSESPRPREEERREEKSETSADAPPPKAEPVKLEIIATPAAGFYFQTFKRKRWANDAQGELFHEIEQAVGPEILTAAIRWAAEKGISDLHAIHSAAKKMRAGPKLAARSGPPAPGKRDGPMGRMGGPAPNGSHV